MPSSESRDVGGNTLSAECKVGFRQSHGLNTDRTDRTVAETAAAGVYCDTPKNRHPEYTESL